MALGLSSAMLIAGCGSSGVDDIQKQISTGLNQQLSQQGQQSASRITASVNCPKNASLKTGSVFYCNATITKFPLTTLPGPASNADQPQTTQRKVMVTIQGSNKAHWVVQ